MEGASAKDAQSASSGASASPSSVRIARSSVSLSSALRQAGARGVRVAARGASAAATVAAGAAARAAHSSGACRVGGGGGARGLLLFLLGATLSAVFFSGARPPARASTAACGGALAIAGARSLSVAAFHARPRWQEQNPFLVAAGWGAADWEAAAAGLVAYRGALASLALGAGGWRAAGHARFDASPAVAPCTPLSRLGGTAGADGGKWICGAAALAPGCIIYSLGSNNEWEFEEAVLAHTPCEVFTFDCTSDPPKRDLGPRLHFEKVCLGEVAGDARYRTLRDIAAAHGHADISLLKMDIEGFEFGVVESMWRGALAGGGGSTALLPAQLTVEVHDVTIMNGLAWSCGDVCARTPPPYGDDVTLRPGDMLPLWVQLTDLGYVVVSREDNAMCTECAEFTLVRAFA